MLSDSLVLAELVSFYLSSHPKIIVIGNCVDNKNIESIFKLLHFNTVIIICSDLRNLKIILVKVKKHTAGKTILLLTTLTELSLGKHITNANSFEVISLNNRLDVLIQSLISNNKSISKVPFPIKTHSSLSKREKEILHLVFNGKTKKLPAICL